MLTNLGEPTDGGLTSLVQTITEMKRAEGVTRTRHLQMRDLAKEVSLESDFTTMNKLCSKFVHPTSWSLLNAGEETERFPSALDIFYSYGAKYVAHVLSEVRPHITKYGCITSLDALLNSHC